MLSSSAGFSKLNKRKKYYETDNMQYNRAELMRMHEQGIEIIIGPKPKPKPKERIRKNLNPPTVTIQNLNIIANENDKNIENNDNKENNKIEGNNENKTDEEYEIKEDIKRIEIRHDQHWFVMKFENANEFYEFLDKFKIFGLLAEEDGILIITNYIDLIGNNTKYRIVKFVSFDRWSPFRIESKNDQFKKFYSDINSIKKKGIYTKTEKTIGIRHHYVWLQLTFRYEWEFEKFIFDSKCYGLVDEHTSLIVRKFKDLEQSDYRLANINNWDQCNAPDLDGSYSGSIGINSNKNNKGASNKKGKKTKTSSSGWW
eukprot:556151_1